MTALRIISSTARQAVSVLQGVALVVVPHGGQRASRANAARAVAVDNDRALDRRRADAAILAATARHPCVRPEARQRPLLVAAR